MTTGKLDKRIVMDVLQNLKAGNVVNLDAKISDVVEAVRKANITHGEEVGFHVLCCDEYFLVTGLQDRTIAETAMQKA
jgi:hypothetical protein